MIYKSNLFPFKTYILFIILIFFPFSALHSKENLLKSSEDYTIGPQDILEIRVWDHPDLTRKAVVSLEGYINYHFIGKVEANGFTTGELAEKISKRLSDGYIIKPQVTVEIAVYRSQKIYISGEAIKPGTYYLTKRTTLVEAISMAGGPTKDADREVIIVRPFRIVKSHIKKKDKLTEKKNNTNSNQLISGKQIRIDFRSALEGDLSQNIYIENGDSIFIPRAKQFFIMGEVRRPGKYNLEKGTTVLRAISLAGGESEKASLGRTKVIRTDDKGKKVERKVKLHEMVEPDDIIIVPESFF